MKRGRQVCKLVLGLLPGGLTRAILVLHHQTFLLFRLDIVVHIRNQLRYRTLPIPHLGFLAGERAFINIVRMRPGPTMGNKKSDGCGSLSSVCEFTFMVEEVKLSMHLVSA